MMCFIFKFGPPLDIQAHKYGPCKDKEAIQWTSSSLKLFPSRGCVKQPLLLTLGKPFSGHMKFWTTRPYPALPLCLLGIHLGYKVPTVWPNWVVWLIVDKYWCIEVHGTLNGQQRMCMPGFSTWHGHIVILWESGSARGASVMLRWFCKKKGVLIRYN